MAPLHQVAMHLVGSEFHQFVALPARLHGLQYLESLEEHGTIVAHGNLLHRIRHGLGLLGYLRGTCHIERIVDVELETAHDGELIPELALMSLHILALGEHSVHDGNDGSGASLTLLTVGQADCIVNHLLYLSSILRQHDLLPLGVIV